MKKLLVVMILAIAVPAMASVTIHCDINTASMQVTLSYEASSGTPKVRAFALDIDVNNGAKITDVVYENPKFHIHPGSIVINKASGVVENEGDIVGDPVKYPGVTRGGRGTNGITIEMATLEQNADQSGVICTFVVDKECCVTVSENSARGGVVMDNATGVDPIMPGNNERCFPPPGCACLGDVIGDETEEPDGKVNLNDLVAIVTEMVINGQGELYEISPPNAGFECADVIGDEIETPDGKLNLNDLVAVVTHLIINGSGELYDSPCYGVE